VLLIETNESPAAVKQAAFPRIASDARALGEVAGLMRQQTKLLRQLVGRDQW
jgi:hypothetical protein